MERETAAYVQRTTKSFAEAVVSVLKAIEKQGWALFQIYNLQERLAAKGFSHPPITVIEMCAAKHADAFLCKNLAVAMCMPCRIAVVQDQDEVRIMSMMPSVLAEFFPEIRLEETQQLQQDLKSIIDSAAL